MHSRAVEKSQNYVKPIASIPVEETSDKQGIEEEMGILVKDVVEHMYCVNCNSIRTHNPYTSSFIVQKEMGSYRKDWNPMCEWFKEVEDWLHVLVTIACVNDHYVCHPKGMRPLQKHWILNVVKQVQTLWDYIGVNHWDIRRNNILRGRIQGRGRRLKVMYENQRKK